MKKTLTIILTTLSLIMIIDSLNAVQALALFFLAGMVPGTNLVISGENMFEFYVLVFGFVLSRGTLHLMRALDSISRRVRLATSHAKRTAFSLIR